MVIRFLLEKEFKQMMRNIILPIVFVLLPIGIINMVPRAATQEVKNLKITLSTMLIRLGRADLYRNFLPRNTFISTMSRPLILRLWRE